jgi:malate dehydrogenase (oxaloacetate-decarboxylating)(NADP+)
MSDLISMLPLVYTPVVGAACETYSENWTGPEGLYLSIQDLPHLDQILGDLAENLGEKNQPQILVVTDGSRILGLGDLGLGGMGISVGKLSLYVAGGGIRPEGCLPVVLDLGTNNEKLLNDPLYLGLRQPRLTLEQAIPFLDSFMSAAAKSFPKAVIQHEDFSSDAAFEYLDRYSKTHRMFNDDIQGTGSVILGGFFAAAKLATKACGGDLKDHRVVFLGGGSAAVG